MDARYLMEIRGVDYGKTVVFYQENTGFRSARGFWFLEYLGHEDVHILDGGIDAWKAAGLPVTRDAWPMAAVLMKQAWMAISAS